ncbi:hypothetical protein CSB20_07420 [bacterium DOLZORAL124_64_63]|nr:MAG: hypothetical protein CSB20_07420 [bacterium DOLZORAL124_64_63]
MPRRHHTSTPQLLLHCLVAAIFILAIGAAVLGYTRSKNNRSIPVKSLKSAQQADAALGYPLPPEHTPPPFDPRFIQLSAFERATVPTATCMTSAMGTAHGALTYNAQPYWSPNPKRGGHHTGDDLNGIGGMDTDLGDPVYAIANGLVIYRGQPAPGWGKTLILAHRDKHGHLIQSMYSHLEKSFAPFGDLIHRGDTIGTVGTANRRYPAHLHLEIRTSSGIHIGPGYLTRPGEHTNPTKTISAHLPTPPDHLTTAPLATVLRDHAEQRKALILGK